MESTRSERLLAWADRIGTPSYVYFLDEARARLALLRDAFSGAVDISFAVKANPAHHLLRGLLGHADALDVSSGGELNRAMAAGWPAAALSFTGPAKREDELRLAVSAGIGEVVVESLDEVRLLSEIAAGASVRQPILVRIAPARVPPGFGDTMSGKPCAFGVDEEALDSTLPEIVGLPGVRVVGFHAYSGTQCLKVTSIVENWSIFADVFARAVAVSGVTPRRLILGSGLGVPYHDDQRAIEPDVLAVEASPVIERLRASHPGARLVLETGRFIVAEAGVMLTRVIRTKESRGAKIGICDAGLNANLAAAGLFGMLLKRNYRMTNLSAEGRATGTDPVVCQLSGPLCTSIDVLGRSVKFPSLEAGDVIAVEVSGAYGPTASPSEFISHGRAREWVVEGEDLYDACAPRG